jgi:curved DNA-binding protein CbpA
MLSAYDVLGVAAGAHQDEIRAAYFSLAKQLHPDRNAGSQRAKQEFQKVNQAYKPLKDANRRSAYDRHLGLMRGEIRRHRRRATNVMVASFTLTTVVVSALLFLAPLVLRGGAPKPVGDENLVLSAHQPTSDPAALVVAKVAA